MGSTFKPRNILAFFSAVLIAPLAFSDPFPGPVSANVLRVIDGDTIEIEAQIWPQQWVRTNVRVRGIDAPEIRRQDCEAERALGHQATERVRDLLGMRDSPIPPTVTLTDIDLDKFGGRYVATVTLNNSQSLATRLMLEDLALPWDGTGRTPDHCDGLE